MPVWLSTWLDRGAPGLIDQFASCCYASQGTTQQRLYLLVFRQEPGQQKGWWWVSGNTSTSSTMALFFGLPPFCSSHCCLFHQMPDCSPLPNLCLLQITDGRESTEGECGQRHCGGMVWHFDGRVVYFVSSRWWVEYRGGVFGSSSSGHVRVPSPPWWQREEKRWRAAVQERSCPLLGLFWISPEIGRQARGCRLSLSCLEF